MSTEALAGLALGGLLLAETLGFVTVLEYGATAKVSRLYGAGQRREALDVGVQATWFALGLGLARRRGHRGRSPIRRSACSRAARRLPTSRG